MNNKLFVAMNFGDRGIEALRPFLEGESLFNRHGDASLAERYGRFGFEAVTPVRGRRGVRWFFRMLRCSYVYFPVGWTGDAMSGSVFAWAEFLGKRMIFEEDMR